MLFRSTATLIFFAIGVASATAAPSSFQRSCSNIRIDATPQQVRIVADCGDGRGGVVRSAIPLRGIHNIDGALMKDGKPESSYQRSCRDARLETSPGGVRLRALCADRGGRGRVTTIPIDDIENRFGQLVESGGARPAPPPPRAPMVVTGQTLTVAQFPQGRYQSFGNRRWAELGNTGGRFDFEEVGRDGGGVRLFDRSRNVTIVLDLRSSWVLYGVGNGPTRRLYPITAVK